MIPVKLQPEPPDFDAKVRKPGHNWLTSNNISLNSAPLKASKLPKYWSKSQKQLWEAYSGTCAYLAIFFEWPTGASSTDHFVAKSKNAGDAYEWNNYRLSCLGPNRNKSNYGNILDPIGLAKNTFVLNLSNGKIKPNPILSGKKLKDALYTIKKLKLDSYEHNQMRARHYTDFLKGDVSETYLKKHSPFVYSEVKRQGLLK